MVKFLFESRFPNRYENGRLISVSYEEYDFLIIPIGPDD